mgnify:CR=1 FL=1
MMKNRTNIVKHATMCHMSMAHSFKDDFTAAFEGNVNETIERNVSKLAEKFGFDEDEAILFLGGEKKLKVNYLGPNAKTMASITNGETNDTADSFIAENVVTSNPNQMINETSVAEDTHSKSAICHLEKYFKTHHKLSSCHLDAAVDSLYMACVRCNIEHDVVIKQVFTGNSFRFYDFISSDEGNLYDFIDIRFRDFASRLVNITAGSNGGMANIGKGERCVSILSGIDPITDKLRVTLIKNGRGDWQFEQVWEEVKWNGGKINVVDDSGMTVNEIFNRLVATKQIELDDRNFVPFRKQNLRQHSSIDLKRLNAIYWEAISGVKLHPLCDNDLKSLMQRKAFSNLFKKSTSIIIFEEDGSFIRFTNQEDATNYYDDIINNDPDKVTFEIRTKQKNAVSMYCHI